MGVILGGCIGHALCTGQAVVAYITLMLFYLLF